MKNSTTFTVVAIWFAIFTAMGILMANPELVNHTDIVSGSLANLTTILCITVPFGILAISVLIAFVWHKESASVKKMVKAS